LASGFAALGVVVVSASGFSGFRGRFGAGAQASTEADIEAYVARLTQPAQLSTGAQRLGAPRADAPSVTDPGSGRLLFPIDPTAKSSVLDNYGDCRSGGRMHIGVDIISERGAAVYAVAAGVLSHRFENTGTAGFGWTLDTADGRRFRYFHLDSFAPGLEVGDRVAFGEVIGFVGSTGNFIDVDGELVEDRNNIHLHFEYWPDRRQSVDPLPLIEVPSSIRIGPPLKACSASSETP
jgi:murein DD-endopeptidase MepM/ murein hydrolase activator NlpD